MQIGPGTRIRHATLQEPGTLGCVLRPFDQADPRRYLLSAAHVLNPGGFGERHDVIEAEDAAGQWQPVATLEDWTPIDGLSPDGIEIDAAIAELRPELAAHWQSVALAVSPAGLASFVFPGMELRVYGAETARLTDAELRSSGGEILVDYRLQQSDLPLFAMKVRDQIYYGLNQGGWHAVTQGGDSGALVTDRFGLAVGLHIGSTNANLGPSVSVCTPIQRILERFQLALDVGATSPGATTAAAPPAAPATLSVPIAQPPAPSPGVALTPDNLSAQASSAMRIRILPLLEPHAYNQGVSWQLTPRGVMAAGVLSRTGGAPLTVSRVWMNYADSICDSAETYKVPVELIVATICTESHGDPSAVRVEPDGRSSVGLMQTLIGTAQWIMGNNNIDKAWLLQPPNSIKAGTAYIANERRHSQFDPPLVAAIYNAGSLRPAFDNRWRFAQYSGSHTHADSFVEWFNDCFAYFDANPPTLAAGVPSFWKLFRT